MRKLLITFAFSAGLLAANGVQAGDAAAGRVKAETCLGCHGVAGYVNTYPTYHVPKLGGQHEAYLVAALKAYKEKQRSHETMHANASALSDDDIADIAAYLSSVK
ncbi:cytochrome C [Chromatiales bacterium (ex Bugula neritina AB1)]|nr:cytochrome C [Chromatiales bacterium (ex Bugula neritina AB1)]